MGREKQGKPRRRQKTGDRRQEEKGRKNGMVEGWTSKKKTAAVAEGFRLRSRFAATSWPARGDSHLWLFGFRLRQGFCLRTSSYGGQVGGQDVGQRVAREAGSVNLIGHPNRFELPHIFIRKLLSDLLKVGHGLRCVQTLPAVQAYFSLPPQECGIGPAPEDLFDLLLYEIPTADGAFSK
jgi:hypothetical protein